MEQEKNKNGVNLLLIFAIVILSMLCILFATDTISLKSKEVIDDSSKQINEKNNNGENNIDNDLLGTYYLNDNNENNTYYFTLKSDGTADVVESSCSNGPLPLKNVSYKITEKDNAVILEIDYNDDGKYMKKYIGNKVLNRFYQTTLGCIGSEDSYYEKR